MKDRYIFINAGQGFHQKAIHETTYTKANNAIKSNTFRISPETSFYSNSAPMTGMVAVLKADSRHSVMNGNHDFLSIELHLVECDMAVAPTFDTTDIIRNIGN